ncbi:hypothetical protein I2486_14355 [Cellulophaga sp. E16_2]|uniref:Uncharacterized protein n=1 Tax=Cellulophaga algicola (strain DSM 14237 / IC166 / ACAM 630) TaxID=688270 RepID=E6XDQ9_CELAD|nr:MULTISPECIES: hypothetical protein [Cellulophaga]ADV50201.1 hypothetical protein Celal_2923 [Cellulophaga algicola DSM 14237]MBO0592585.1 hypothetical protein [Cellulophaga sp. E16_2]
MEKFVDNVRLKNLKKQLQINANKVVSKNKRASRLGLERAIKTELALTLNNFINQEVKKVSVKTYDWYFFDTVGSLRCYRNDLNKNRYFIVDYVNVNLDGLATFVSLERKRELPISDEEIKKRISSSAAIFAKMLTVTVSKKEDAKIWKAYDTVDESKIIMITIGIPLAIIGGVELFPALVAEGELIASSVSYIKNMFSTYNMGLTLNSSLQTSLAFGFGDAAAQYVGNGFDITEVDPYKAAITGVFKFNPSSVLLRSSFNAKQKNNYKLKQTKSTEVLVDFTFGMLGGSVNKTIGSFGLIEFNNSMGGFLTHTMRLGVNSSKTATAKKVKIEIEGENNIE